mmetsp:Transcript_71047/g.170207  ORF Transcript_71047/g.170207 Transcript_71047/m.170207 type:complete len:129 (-) Transcript_71047:100-486(-)
MISVVVVAAIDRGPDPTRDRGQDRNPAPDPDLLLGQEEVVEEMMSRRSLPPTTLTSPQGICYGASHHTCSGESWSGDPYVVHEIQMLCLKGASGTQSRMVVTEVTQVEVEVEEEVEVDEAMETPLRLS